MLLVQSFIRRTFTTTCAKAAMPLKIITQLLINGKFVNAAKGRTLPIINPATEKIIAEVQQGETYDTEMAVRAARKAFDGPWRRMSGVERGRIMFKLASLIKEHADELALLESLNTGKPISIAKNMDLYWTFKFINYYAGFTDKLQGQTIPVSGPFICYTRYEPIGVCGSILPFNFPILEMAEKIGPALAAGNTIVLKPSELTPLTALRVGELALEAGLPPGVLNIITGDGEKAGQALVRSSHVDKVSFTGSTYYGLHVMKQAQHINLKKVSLELGGKNANIVMDDADIDLAVRKAHSGVFFNAGQIANAGSRVFVHEKVYDEFVARSVDLAKKRIVGDPLDPKTEQGPLIDHIQRNKFSHFVRKGKTEGAVLKTGGNVIDRPGFFVEPTIFSDVTDDMTIAKEEIFSPVMSILKFSSVDEVIARANKTQYGLAGAVFTKNIETAIKICNALRVGVFWVNCYNVLRPNTPFGGMKNSGLGRMYGEEALKSFTELKTVIIRRSNDSLP